MALLDLDSPERPAKKARLSDEYDEDDEYEPVTKADFYPQESSPPSSAPQRFFSDAAPRSDASHHQVEGFIAAVPSSPPRQHLPIIQSPARNGSSMAARPEPPTLPHESSSVSFETDMFEAFVGHKVESDVLQVIRENCHDSLERAVNIYLDGTWKMLKRQPPVSVPGPSTVKPGPTGASPESRSVVKTMERSRYVGAFGVEGWATRSGHNLLRHGDKVRIERQKIQLPQTTKAGPKKFGAPVVTARMTAAAARRVDVIVRFTSLAGSEIGRLSKDAANWVSSLMDQNICVFEGTCVYAPERLRTNDTVFLQLRVSLLPTAFQSQVLGSEPDIKVSFKEQEETSQEKHLRLRQVALVRLFQEINLLPTTLNATAAKEQRQVLLQAAEQDETKAKELPKLQSPKEAPGTSSPAEEDEDGQELEQDQLDALYRKAQSFDFTTPMAEPADTFALSLRPYQKQALHWMLSKEKDEKNNREPSLHPLWEEYTWPDKDVDDKDVAAIEGQDKFYVNPYSGEMTLNFPAQEQHCLGGILADEMGLGKTIQMLSLVHTNRPHEKVSRPQSSLFQLRSDAMGPAEVMQAPHTTLVIAPMSLLAQWNSEAEKASKEDSLKTFIYYGSEKNQNLQAMCCAENGGSAPDVVITSYGTVLSEYSQLISKKMDKASHTGLFSLSFFRLILDEAHTIKNRRSKTSKACYQLAAEHRWVLTGTPIVNRLEDLFSLVRFLGVEPWSNFSFWRTFITVPFESKNFVRALDVVQTVLEPLVMRRTKDMKTPDGEPLVPLPTKTVEIVRVALSKPERDIYDHIFWRAKTTFDDSVASGGVMKSYASLFAQLIRLRQTCCHPILVRNKAIVADEVEAAEAADAAAGMGDDVDLDALMQKFTAEIDQGGAAKVTFGAHALEQIRSEASHECPICMEKPMEEQTVTGCWHSACKKCLVDYMKHQSAQDKAPRCVQCREPLDARDLFEVIRHDDVGDDDDDDADTTMIGNGRPRISLQRVGSNDSSAKVMTLIRHLRALRREHPRIKSVVFSQFTSFLSLIEPALARANMGFVRLDGSMSQKARAAVLARFEGLDRFTILLISLKAGGVGLNLTSAQRVYMMDPWWSFAVEAQAIDRVHRMGQEKEVKVYRFIVEGSVEERMLKVQDRKKFIASSLGMMSDEEKKLQRVEDIKELLS